MKFTGIEVERENMEEKKTVAVKPKPEGKTEKQEEKVTAERAKVESGTETGKSKPVKTVKAKKPAAKEKTQGKEAPVAKKTPADKEAPKADRKKTATVAQRNGQTARVKASAKLEDAKAETAQGKETLLPKRAAEEMKEKIEAKSMPKAPLKILFTASECTPFVKTGGLADVVGSLPRELARLGADIRVMLPEYNAIPDEYRQKWELVSEFTVDMGWRKQYCGVHRLVLEGVTFYFLDNKQYFGRDYIYGNFTSDEAERFAFFSKAVLEAMRHLDFYPDVLHAHDWQAAMSIALLRLQYGLLPNYRDIRTIITIHNLRFQGVFPWERVADMLNLSWDCFTNDKLEYYGCINFLKAGIVYADLVTTVSPTYSYEIRSAYYGEQLDGLLRARENSLYGILNGIDLNEWNPSIDRYIVKTYSPKDMGGKSACKEALQKEFNLDIQSESLVLAMVTRMTDQKGFDLVERVINEIVESGVQLAVLGRGDSRYEGLLSWAAWRYPGRVGVRYEQNEAIAHRVYAGADLYLMPSKFEPCGLSQIIAMRYGAIPIVRETGGLKDTVLPYNKFEDSGNGFSFANYNAHEMLDAIYRAIGLHHDLSAWNRMIERDMNTDFGWTRSAKAYIGLYRKLCP